MSLAALSPSQKRLQDTYTRIITQRSALAPMLDAFLPLFAAKLACQEELQAQNIALSLPSFESEKASMGLALLSYENELNLAPFVCAAASHILPALQTMPGLEASLPALEAFFSDRDKVNVLLEKISIAGAETVLPVQEAAWGEIDASILAFAAELTIAPILHVLVAKLIDQESELYPWQNAWNFGHCPVCGAFPSIAYLAKARLDTRNTYLVSGGGTKYLHCGLCGAEWNFTRGVCPACSSERKGAAQILYEQGKVNERLDWCADCKSYCPTVDLRAQDWQPDLDFMALGMLHLDIIAAQKKLLPLRKNFWNAL